MSRTRRSAFTLIELLIVISIIAVLIGLLVPAVQKVREAAMRAKCQNNLHQVGLGLLLHEGSHNSLPPAVRGDRGTWRQSILPYIEQEPLWKRIDHDQAWHQADNLNLGATTPIPVFLCPSVPYRSAVDWVVVDGKPVRQSGKPLGACDYETVIGLDPSIKAVEVGWNELDEASRSKRCEGAMVPNRPTRLVDLIDGASQTILVIETAGRPDLWQGPGGRQQTPFAVRDGSIQGLAHGTCWADASGPYILRPSQAIALENRLPAANSPLLSNDRHPFGFHPGGVVATLADGSVRFFRNPGESDQQYPWFTARGYDLCQLD